MAWLTDGVAQHLIKTIMNAFFTPDPEAVRSLSLHQLTALDAPPAELIAIAGRLGCSHVCLFTFVPEQAQHVYPCVTPGELPVLADALSAASVELGNLEVFPLDSDASAARFEEALATGAALGASRATAHVHGANLQEAILRFGEFCDRAAGHGLKAGLEFNGFSAVRDAATAEAVVRGAARANGEVVLDLLHLVRSGGSMEQVAQLADLIGYAQLCDGPMQVPDGARWREAVGERLLPGEGEFPLKKLLQPLRLDTLIEVEVPQTAARKAGVSALERARRAVEASRRIVG